MSTLETPGVGWPEERYIDVALPVNEIDDEWCGWFNIGFGLLGKRAMIETHHVIVSAEDSPHAPGMRLYETIPLAPADKDGVIVDGVVVGARMIPVPIYDVYTGEIATYDYLPHVVMTDAFDSTSNESITSVEHERVFFPIDKTGDSITLY